MGSLCSREGRCVARARTFEIDVDLLARRAAPGGSRPRGARGAGRGLRPAPRGINAPASASASTSASGSAWAAQGGGGGSGGSRRRRRRGWRQEERGECTVRREEEEELRRRHRRRHRRWPSISLPQATGTFTVRGICGSGVWQSGAGRAGRQAVLCPLPRGSQPVPHPENGEARTAPRRPSRGGFSCGRMRWASIRSSVHPAKSGSRCGCCCSSNFLLLFGAPHRKSTCKYVDFRE